MKRYHGHQQFQKVEELYEINEKIRVPVVFLISDEGPLGEFPIDEALAKAQEAELDLVLVGPKATPPVAKILDYKSFKYQKEKEAKKQKAHSKQTQIKILRLSPRIGKHDFDVRVNKAVEFIQDKDKVKVEIQLKGREKAHADVAFDVIKEFVTTVEGLVKTRVEAPVKKEGSTVGTILGPQ
ncbi:translation initiation factor IF-3 [Candidatus Falkowbacteria bacterium]|nr:translation initiation factor IF-3 [Candidatus Falkowbacteria bacterium]